MSLRASLSTPNIVYKVKIPINFVRCLVTSSVGKPTNTPFRFNSWIMALVISNVIFGRSAEGMIALISVGSMYLRSLNGSSYGGKY